MRELDKAQIGQRIRQLRGTLTQVEFAHLLGVNRISIVRYEGGERTPDAEFLAAVGERFEVDPMWLLTGAERPAGRVLTVEEIVLLDNYRAAAESARAALRATSAALAQRPAGGGAERDDAECA